VKLELCRKRTNKSDPRWIALKKEVEIMKRITLVLGIVAVMVTLSAPSMAKDNGGNKGSSNGNGHHNGGGGLKGHGK
jgi:hypothetical protein